ncbi:MAG: hypothetical protein Fur0010_04890 [Bdellovibrio sp.]
MNSNINARSHKKFEPECVHSRNIMAYIDLSDKDLSYLPFGKHLVTCALCQDALLKAKKVLTEIDHHIPVQALSPEQYQVLGNEISQMLRKIKLKEFEKGWKKVQRVLSFSQTALSDMGKVLVTRKMVIVYAVAGLLFMTLKQF